MAQQDVSGGQPVPVEGTELPLWGLEIDPERARDAFRAFAGKDGGQVPACCRGRASALFNCICRGVHAGCTWHTSAGLQLTRGAAAAGRQGLLGRHGPGHAGGAAGRPQAGRAAGHAAARPGRGRCHRQGVPACAQPHGPGRCRRLLSVGLQEVACRGAACPVPCSPNLRTAQQQHAKRCHAQVVEFVRGEEYARFTRIVFDTAPTGHTLRLLTVPDFVEASLGKLIRLRKKLAAAGGAVRGLFGASEKQDEAVAKLEALKVRRGGHSRHIAGPLILVLWIRARWHFTGVRCHRTLTMSSAVWSEQMRVFIWMPCCGGCLACCGKCPAAGASWPVPGCPRGRAWGR